MIGYVKIAIRRKACTSKMVQVFFFRKFVLEEHIFFTEFCKKAILTVEKWRQTDKNYKVGDFVMSMEFERKRIEYLNNWPNVEPFEIEKQYYSLVDKMKLENRTIFIPFPLKTNTDLSYNKTISFMVEAVEQLEKNPNYSYEFIFKAYDCFSSLFYGNVKQITDKNKWLCDNEWTRALDEHPRLHDAFIEMLRVMPVKACQYLYSRLAKDGEASYNRTTTSISGGTTIESEKRKELIDSVKNKYGYDCAQYSESIRKASLLYRHIFTDPSVVICDKTYAITTQDKLHILVSGFLYTLRNDTMHGDNISITKSSKTTLGTYAVDYFAYLLLYYLLLLLILKRNSSDYSMDVYDLLAENIEKNTHLYKLLFGKETEK